MTVVAIILILASINFSINGQSYGGNPMTTSAELVNALNTCKMRAISSRRWHRCQVQSQSLTVYQWSSTGMTSPGSAPTACGSPATPPCYYQVQNYALNNPVTIWDGSTTICTASPCAGAPSSANSSLVFNFDFRPDGSSTGGTIFITDVHQNNPYRVLVYKSTGSSYARSGW